MKVNNSSDSSSGYTNAAYSSKGIAGLASGIDTESVVEAMLMNEQNKIDKQTQKQQVLEWKQDAYRDVITKINDFQDKYFNLTSDSCIRLNSLYNTMSAESSSKAVTVTPSSSAEDGDFTMQVAQLATSASVTSGKAASNVMKTTDGVKAGGFSFSREIKIKIGDNTETVDLTDVDSLEAVAEKINRKVDGLASINESISVKDKDGKAVSYKLYDSDGSEYKGNVAIKLDDDGKPKFYKEGASGPDDTELDVKYYHDNKSDEEITDTSEFQFADTVTKELKLNANDETASIEVSGSTAGLAILGLSSGAKSDKGVLSTKAVNTNLASAGTVNGSVSFTLDGITKSFDITESTEDGKTNTMAELMNKVKAAFGGAVTFEEVKDGEGNPTGNYSISVKGVGRQLTISANADTMAAMGFDQGTKSLSSQVRRSDTLESLGFSDGSLTINGAAIDYEATDTISSLMNKINSSDAGVKMTYNDLSATFKLESQNSGEGFEINLDDDQAGLLSNLGFNVSGNTFTDFKAGQNAIVNINGTTVERSSNKMNYNGQLIDLNATTGKYQVDTDTGKFLEDGNGNFVVKEGTTEEKAEITSSRNVDKIYDTLKSFVDDYNTLIEDLNKMTHEEATYKKYPPLTDAQKKEMTEKEIELWEEKSKQGLLRNDSEINSFLQQMRSAMYTKGDSKYVLSNIGINSSSQWSDYGKLSIDEDTLKSALKSDAAEVAKIFTGDNGLGARLNDICKKTANTSSGSRGLLVIKAGVKGKATEKDNEIYDQLQTIKEKLEKLNKKYESKKERLWKQFNAMEKAMSKANSQSDYFANYM